MTPSKCLPYCCTHTFVLLLVLTTTCTGEEVPKGQASPRAVARESFEALKSGDIAGYVSLFHPAELERFHKLAVAVFSYEESDPEIEQIRKLFAPYESTKSVAAANGSALLAAQLKNMFIAAPELKEFLAEAELEILGEIEERDDLVHVVTRTVLPRPEPHCCQKHEGRWYLRFHQEQMKLFYGFERKQHFRKKKLSNDEIRARTTIDKMQVIGHVQDGENVAQVLCRVVTKIDDFKFELFACYPVRRGEKAWEHLNDENKTMLIEAMRANWAAK